MKEYQHTTTKWKWAPGQAAAARHERPRVELPQFDTTRCEVGAAEGEVGESPSPRCVEKSWKE
eukprot:15060514-Alexandrium_andersonii.AAC.1